MTNDEAKLISRRDALATLGAIGISGMVRINGQGKDFKTRNEDEKAPDGADESDDQDKAAAMKTIGVLGENAVEADLVNPAQLLAEAAVK